MKKVLSMLSLLLISLLPLSALERVISPASGVWSNKQSLVLNTRDGADCYYSYSGTDPLTSGFMYDGPVLIDADGDVTVRIVCVSKHGNREEYRVSYTVQCETKLPFEEQSIERNFIDRISSEPLWLFTVGDHVTIPDTFFYCLGDGVQPYLTGKTLSVSLENRLSRYIPCTVTTKESAETAEKAGDAKNPHWRFVIFLAGGEAGTLAKYDVPFTLTDWTRFQFTGAKFIYAIDNGMWSANKDPQTLDRTVSHTVYWQSIAYERGNPVQSFVLPPKPELSVREVKADKGPVVFSIEGDARYRMEIVSSGNSADAASSDGLFTQVAFDTFEGDAIGGEAVFALFCDGVYQGELSAPYNIDNKPPLAPVITPSVATDYARRPVALSFSAEAGATIFYAVSEAVSVEEHTDAVLLAQSTKAENYRPYTGDTVVLPSGEETALFYKVCAYAVDKAGNTGTAATYTVTIDEYNYFLSEAADDDGDGSKNRPFNCFSDALSVINSGRYAHFFVSGTIVLPSGETAFTSNCSFTALDNARFVLPADGTLVVRSASFAAENCTFEKTALTSGKKVGTASFFTLENAAVSFTGCELVGVFESNGTAFTASGSVIDFSNSGLTVQGSVYVCGISASESKVTGKESRFSCVAPTAVNFSVQGGLFELRSSECKVVSHLGRIAELSRTNARLTKNSYTGEFDSSKSKVSPVWSDSATLLLENAQNVQAGF